MTQNILYRYKKFIAFCGALLIHSLITSCVYAQSVDLTIEQADSAAYSGDCKNAVPALKKSIDLHPQDGASISALGYCEYVAGDLKKAINTFKKASTFSPERSSSLYNLAAIYSLLGDNDKAIQTLTQYIDNGEKRHNLNGFGLLKDSDFDNIKSDPRFLSQIRRLVGEGYEPEPLQKWNPSSAREGVTFVMDIIHSRHPNPYRYYSREDFQRYTDDIILRAPDISLETYTFELMRLVAMVGDIHTSIWLQSNTEMLRSTLPLRLWRFEDGLFIRAAAPKYQHLIGAKILDIGNYNIDKNWEKLVKENPRENEWMAMTWLQFLLLLPEFHISEGWAKQSNLVQMQVEMPNGRKQNILLSPTKDRSFGSALESSASFSIPDGWLEGNPTGKNMPIWLKARQKNYWFTQINDTKAVYASVKNPRPNLKKWNAFLDELFAAISTTDADKLIFDLRHNAGGYDYIVQELIHRIIRTDAINRPGGICVISSRTAQSAGVTFAAAFERETPAIIVGEPVGGAPNYYNAPQGFFSPKAIPGTPLRIRYSSVAESYSDPRDTRRAIGPDIWAPMTYKDFSTGQDPALSACLKLDKTEAKSYLSDPGGREIPLYFQWRRPSQAAMLHNK